MVPGPANTFLLSVPRLPEAKSYRLLIADEGVSDYVQDAQLAAIGGEEVALTHRVGAVGATVDGARPESKVLALNACPLHLHFREPLTPIIDDKVIGAMFGQGLADHEPGHDKRSVSHRFSGIPFALAPVVAMRQLVEMKLTADI